MTAKQSASDLAINGGTPVRTAPFPPRRLFGPEEKAAADAVFDEAIATGQPFGYAGPHEQAYEKAFAEFLGGGLAKTVNSGTSAILAALAALEPEPGSEVVCPPISDPGGVMPVPVMNCVPVPADADGGSFNAGADQIAAACTERTRAVIVAHILGEPADMPAIMDLARRRGLFVIEDCAQAHGATIAGRPVGTWGHLAAFSTMSGKHHASGAQGGVVFTRDETLFWKARRFMDRGKCYGLDADTGNVMLGLNLNSNDLASAIAAVQLGKLPSILQRRRAIAAAVADGLRASKALTPGRLAPSAVGSYWFLRITVDASRLTVDKEAFAQAVAAEGIPVTASYRHVPSEQPWFREHRGLGRGGCPWTCPRYAGDPDATFQLPNCQRAIASNFLIAIHENWMDQEVKDTLAALAKVHSAYLKT